jgi:Secretion system C-terminal sorting domain
VVYTATDRSCVATSCSFNVSVQPLTNAVEEKTAFSIRLFPNPTEGSLFLELESTTFENILFICTNTIGQVLFSEKRKLVTGLNQLNFNVSGLPKGVYFIEIRGNKPVKFVKM